MSPPTRSCATAAVAGGTAFTSFSDAVNRSYYDRPRGERIAQLTIFHQVVAFGALAETTAATLKRGTTVTVSGQLAHDSYSPDGSDRIIRRHRLEAADVAVSLRWATATVTRARDTNGTTSTESTEGEADAGQSEDSRQTD